MSSYKRKSSAAENESKKKKSSLSGTSTSISFVCNSPKDIENQAQIEKEQHNSDEENVEEF